MIISLHRKQIKFLVIVELSTVLDDWIKQIASQQISTHHTLASPFGYALHKKLYFELFEMFWFVLLAFPVFFLVNSMKFDICNIWSWCWFLLGSVNCSNQCMLFLYLLVAALVDAHSNWKLKQKNLFLSLSIWLLWPLLLAIERYCDRTHWQTVRAHTITNKQQSLKAASSQQQQLGQLSSPLLSSHLLSSFDLLCCSVQCSWNLLAARWTNTRRREQNKNNSNNN